MGNCIGRREAIIRISVQCPRCGRAFPKGTSYQKFNSHLDNCLQQVEGPIHEEVEHLSFWEKVPHGDQFKWEKKHVDLAKGHLIRQKSAEKEVRSLCFGEKQVWFRGKLESMRIPWQNGCKQIQVSQSALVETSQQQLSQLSVDELHGELKIKFLEDTKVQDAGGVLREWMNMVTTTLVEQNSLKRLNTDEVIYDMTSVSKTQEFALFGCVVGKALFEKIPIKVYLSRTILKQILGQQITHEDIKFYDPSLYCSFKYMLENEIDPLEVMLDFTIEKDGTYHDLKPNGQNIVVNNENKYEYMDLAIKFLSSTSIEQNMNIFLEEFYKVIPQEYIAIFQPEELEMVLFGLPFINLDEWRENTVYSGKYNARHQVIKWFWGVLEEFTQAELQNFLRFCTGSSRTPVEGFKQLEGNRGEIYLFTIQSQEYQTSNPFPKAHTCFNRLDLPIYETQEQLRQYVRATLDSILLGQFGLE